MSQNPGGHSLGAIRMVVLDHTTPISSGSTVATGYVLKASNPMSVFSESPTWAENFVSAKNLNRFFQTANFFTFSQVLERRGTPVIGIFNRQSERQQCDFAEERADVEPVNNSVGFQKSQRLSGREAENFRRSETDRGIEEFIRLVIRNWRGFFTYSC